MTASSGSPTARVGQRVVGIASATALMATAVLLAAHLHGRGAEVPAHPVAPRPMLRGEPIPSEALVFRLSPADLAVAPSAKPRTPAHQRTLAMYRTLRAYPGAPPRIPHGLTADEFRGTTCLGCHLRGGYVPRFAAYAPPSPHPEHSDCLQCHLTDAPRVGIELPASTSRESCGQCHRDPDALPPTFVALDWRPPSWPPIAERTADGSPPPVIPHDLQLRGNCLACHAGPAAVEEIRTAHPERTSCRQCHLPAPPGQDVFTRPLDPSIAGSGNAL